MVGLAGAERRAVEDLEGAERRAVEGFVDVDDLVAVERDESDRVRVAVEAPDRLAARVVDRFAPPAVDRVPGARVPGDFVVDDRVVDALVVDDRVDLDAVRVAPPVRPRRLPVDEPPDPRPLVMAWPRGTA